MNYLKISLVDLSISAQASHRTVCDNLSSHGSSYSNCMRFPYIRGRCYPMHCYLSFRRLFVFNVNNVYIAIFILSFLL